MEEEATKIITTHAYNKREKQVGGLSGGVLCCCSENK